MSHTGRILVYRLSALGDVAMTIPAIYSCARQWPDRTFCVVTSKFCAQLFLNAPSNVELHPIEPPVSTLGVLRQIGGMQVDAVADLHNVLRSWVVDAYFLLRGKSVSMLRKHRRERHAVLGPQKSSATPFTQRYFDVFARLGMSCRPQFTSLFPALPPLPTGFSKGNSGQEEASTDKGDERWVGIAPFARYASKIYPLEQMQRIAFSLAGQPATRVLLFGSRGREAEELSQWATLSPRIEVVAGRLPSLADELALMAHLDVMVTMDSSNQHMASLVGTRVVSVWGSTTPACGFLAWGQLPSDAVCQHLPCQPCSIGGSARCRLGTLECMTTLPPEAITSQVYKALASVFSPSQQHQDC